MTERFARRFIVFSLTMLVAVSALVRAEVGWLDGNPDAIWNRPPGFYKQGGQWYAIIHVKQSVTRVRLAGEFTDWEQKAVELTKTPDGKFWWFKGTDQSFPTPPTAGQRYQFILNEGDGPNSLRPDPAARRVENSSLGSKSIVTIGSDYPWHDAGWSRPPWPRYLIYQLHPLRFTDRNRDAEGKPVPPLRQVAEELDNDGGNDYLNRLGITAIQLLPVNEFPIDISWGYNPSFFYAVESSYGTSDELKALVDTAHRNGIAVILDVVYNHGSSTDNILGEIDTGTYYDGDTAWGPMINFDNDVARHFFVQNAVYLAREYHIDGIRFDFTRPIHNETDGNIRVRGSGGGWNFLRAIRAKVKSVDPNIVLIAEELPNTWWVTQERVDSNWGGDWHGPFDSQWTDAFHDNFKAVLTGQHLDHLYDVFTYFGDSWQDALVYSESHDEVGNTDDRIARRARDGKGWEMDQLAAAGTVLARGIPMIFMGQEGGEWMQFGQDNGKLREYNPGTGDTWWDDRLPLAGYETNPGQSKVREWYKALFTIRKSDPEGLAWPNIAITHLHDQNGIVAFTRDDGKYLVVLNFRGKDWERYRVGVSGRYRELANTSWPEFNLGGYAARTRGRDQAQWIDDIPIPAYGAVVLKREN